VPLTCDNGSTCRIECILPERLPHCVPAHYEGLVASRPRYNLTSQEHKECCEV
jgi:hypothetical protein